MLVIVIICFFTVCSAFGIVNALVPALRRRSTRLWISRRVGSVSAEDASLVEQVRFARSLGAALGGLAGVAAGAAVTSLVELDESFRAWPVILGFAAGALLGQTATAFRQVFTTPRGGVRLARTRPARLSGYLPGLMRWSIGLAVGLAVAAGLYTAALLVVAGGTLDGLPGLGAAVVVTVAFCVVSLRAARRLILRPQPADTEPRAATVQALRTEQVHDLVGMQFTFAICTAALAASPVQNEVLRLAGNAGWTVYLPIMALAAVVLLAFVGLVSSVVRQLSGPALRLASAEG